jgi:hypothetical protein
LPAKKPQRLGQTWSSMCSPAAPAASNSRTVRSTLTGFPYPVSASQITGISTQPAMLRAFSTISLIVSNPMSGRPRAAAVPKPVM